MAHRRPLGTTTGLMTFDWAGPTPEPGDYLVSEAGTWYRVAGVEGKANPAKVGLMLERIADPTGQRAIDLATLGYTIEDDEVRRRFEFYWHSRARRDA